jgi:hypothetical protein
MGWIGAIVAMVIAGLIVSGIVYYGPSIISGLQGGSGGSNSGAVLSVRDVVTHAAQHQNEEITVRGKYNLGRLLEIDWSAITGPETICPNLVLENISNLNLIGDSSYLITGTLSSTTPTGGLTTHYLYVENATPV